MRTDFSVSPWSIKNTGKSAVVRVQGRYCDQQTVRRTLRGGQQVQYWLQGNSHVTYVGETGNRGLCGE